MNSKRLQKSAGFYNLLNLMRDGTGRTKKVCQTTLIIARSKQYLFFLS